MKILYLTKGDRKVASSNERVWIIADLILERYRIESDIVSARHASTWLIAKKLLSRSYDIVIAHKSIFTAESVLCIVIARYLFRKPLVYDLDDAQWLHSPWKSRLLARTADIIFAGSHAIMEWAEQYNSNVVHMPTLVDHLHFARSRVEHTKKDIYTIGWVGGGPEHFKKGNFHILKPVLDELARRGHKFQIYLVGTRGHELLEKFFISAHYGLTVVPFVPYDHVPEQIHMFDVGVMPLQDTPFERAKCAAKAIQYMACRIPPVVSAVGENIYVVDHGVNGFCVSTTDEWVRAIEALLSDTKLRNQIGQAGLEKVADNYSHNAIVRRYIEVLKTL